MSRGQAGQCPVGAKEMSRQRAAPRRARAPDQASRCTPGSRTDQGSANASISVPAPDPAPGCASTSQASRIPHPERLDAPRAPARPGDAARSRSTFQRPTQRCRLELIESLDGLDSRRALDRAASHRCSSRAYLAQAHQRLAFNRHGAPLACVPCSSRRAHESNHARPGETPRSPPRQSHAPHDSAPAPDPREATPTHSLNDNPNRYPESPASRRPGSRPGLDPAQRDLNRPARASASERPVRHLHPGVEQWHQIFDPDGVGRVAPATPPPLGEAARHRPAPHPRAFEQRRFEVRAKHRLRRRRRRIERGREISYAWLRAVFEPCSCCPAKAVAAH